MDDKKIQFVPFNAINEFMLPDFRTTVLQKVFSNQVEVPSDRRNHLNSLIKHLIKIPGFRNSAAAPTALKIKNAASPFERNAQFTAAVLSCWESLDPELAEKVFNFLKSREWELLPVVADRTKIPGFMINWPESENYDTLGEGFKAMYPGYSPSDDDLRLMIVWIGGRLPYNMTFDEAQEA